MHYQHETSRPAKPYCHTLPEPYPDGWPDVTQYLHTRGLSADVARHNGWYPSIHAGDAMLRVVIPCLSTDPRNKFWQARLIYGHGPRYQSPHASRGDAIVYVRPLSPLRGSVLVEGPMDALAAAEAGYLGFAWMGMVPSDAMLALAKLLGTPPWIVVPDAGTEAEAAAVRVWHHFSHATLVLPYPFKDLAEAPLEARKELLER